MSKKFIALIVAASIMAMVMTACSAPKESSTASPSPGSESAVVSGDLVASESATVLPNVSVKVPDGWTQGSTRIETDKMYSDGQGGAITVSPESLSNLEGRDIQKYIEKRKQNLIDVYGAKTVEESKCSYTIGNGTQLKCSVEYNDKNLALVINIIQVSDDIIITTQTQSPIDSDVQYESVFEDMINSIKVG